MNIGERIRSRRVALGMTQDELASKLGYKSRSSINKIEADAQNLTQPKIKAMAQALETTVSYLMGWGSEDDYYIVDGMTEKTQDTFDDKEYQILFKALRTLKPESLEEVKKFVDFKKSLERGGRE